MAEKWRGDGKNSGTDHLLLVVLGPRPPREVHPPRASLLPLAVHLQWEVHLQQEVRRARLPLAAVLFHPQEEQQLALHLPLVVVPHLLQVQPLAHPLNKYMHLTIL